MSDIINARGAARKCMDLVPDLSAAYVITPYFPPHTNSTHPPLLQNPLLSSSSPLTPPETHLYFGTHNSSHEHMHANLANTHVCIPIRFVKGKDSPSRRRSLSMPRSREPVQSANRNAHKFARLYTLYSLPAEDEHLRFVKIEPYFYFSAGMGVGVTTNSSSNPSIHALVVFESVLRQRGTDYNKRLSRCIQVR